ncbi:hypothetical protein GJAV_G00015280 [Gymnothorax javanicus]|nr:hypothetical protein GJAV_G00015280 [Gymnothorax javanicus]
MMPNSSNCFIMGPAPSQGLVLQERLFQHADTPALERKAPQRKEYTQEMQRVRLDSMLTCPETSDKDGLLVAETLQRRVQSKQRQAYSTELIGPQPPRIEESLAICDMCCLSSKNHVSCQNCGYSLAFRAPLKEPCHLALARPPIHPPPQGPEPMQFFHSFYSSPLIVQAPQDNDSMTSRACFLTSNRHRGDVVCFKSPIDKACRGKRQKGTTLLEEADTIVLSSDEEEKEEGSGIINRIDSISPCPADSAHSSPAPTTGRVETAMKDCPERDNITSDYFSDMNARVSLPQKMHTKDPLPLLSGSASEEMGLIHFTIPEELKVEELNAVDSGLTMPLTRSTVIRVYQDVFTGPVGALPGEVHFDLDPALQPVQSAPRNVPVAMKEAVKAQLDQYERAGHITSLSEPTEWISNMVIVKRPEKLRICLQPHHLNQALRRSHYLMPTLEDVLYKLPKAKVFKLVDARDAFLQCKLDEASSLMTTFWTPWGRKRWLKLPFGMSVAPEVYQRKQHELLEGLEGVEPIADDILIVGCGDNEEAANKDHDHKLIALLNHCRQVNLRLSVKKLQFRVSEVRFHGHILSAAGLKADLEKVRAVVDMPAPADIKGVRRLIGFVIYLAKFLPRLSEVCEPLRRLTDKNAVWHWLPKHDAAIREIKQLVTTMPVLRYYDVSKPVTVQSDSSQHGMGCCFMEEGQPIAFACQRFHHYLYGRNNITAETDHKPLVAIFGKPLLNAPKRLQSMLLALQNYNLRVIYRPGPDMHVSDTLSRAVASKTHPGPMHAEHTVCSMVDEQLAIEHINMADYLNVTDKRLLQIQRHTDDDGQLQAVKATILKGWPTEKNDAEQVVRDYWPIKEELSVQNGVLFRGQRVVIPRSLHPEMLARVHGSHIGGEACYRQARETLYWPGMQSEIKDYVSKCSTCNEYAIEQQKETMLSHELPTNPWQIVSLNLFQHSGKDFLLVVDHYSDFWEIDVLPDLSAETTIKRCKAQFARYGQPDRVISDNGPQFACTQFRQFAVEWGFEHITSSPRHPKANGKAEAAVKIAKNLCKKALRDGEDAWKAILQWRNTPTEGMDSSPAQRLMARRLKSALPVVDALLEPRVVTDVVDKLRHRKQVSKLIYDRTAKDLPELAVGEAVRMKPLPGDRTGIWRRGVCLQKAAPRSYLVEVEGCLYRHN